MKSPTAHVSAPTALCITGMHRSGTSMVARVLDAVGLWLGPPERLMQSGPDNPEGFFENLDLVHFSDEFLDRFGGGWDTPPDFPDGWEQSELARELGTQAYSLLQSIANTAQTHPGWGWKDPRCSLMLPFWRTLIGDLKIIACVRHPVAVARSLHKRGTHSPVFSFRLWEQYNSHIRKHASDTAVLVTDYDNWIKDPGTELDRVMLFLGWDLAGGVRDNALGEVMSSLRHYKIEGEDWLPANGRAEIAQLYLELQALARVPAPSTTEPGVSPIRVIDAAPARGNSMDLSVHHQPAELKAEMEANQYRHPWYRVGSTIDFTQAGNAQVYQQGDWTSASEAGTWSLGTRARLRLDLVRAHGRSLRLSARLKPILGGRLQTIIDGKVVAHHALLSERMNDVSVVIPQASLRGLPRLEVEFRIDQACSPKHLGKSDDQRPLGIFFNRILLENVE